METVTELFADYHAVLLTFAVCYGFILAAVFSLWLVSIPIRNISIIDMFWGAGFGCVALICWVLQQPLTTHQFILALLPILWSIRYTIFILRRNLGHGEDPRYTKLRSWMKPGQSFNRFSLRKVFLMQGNVMWLVSLPLMLGMSLDPVQTGWVTWIGVIVWVIGFLFEAVGDWQLTRFKKNPDNRGRILNTGLWRYTRHPNYFGNATLWWGIFLVACENPWCLITVVGPLYMNHMLVNVTGQRTLEKKMLREKPGYKEYVKSTSGFIPRFSVRQDK